LNQILKNHQEFIALSSECRADFDPPITGLRFILVALFDLFPYFTIGIIVFTINQKLGTATSNNVDISVIGEENSDVQFTSGF